MKTVIIIEDEKDARQVIRECLLPYNDLVLICECDNGKDAIEKINELRPDIIFLDVQLPGLNGFEVIDRLQHKPSVVITTAHEDYAIKAFNYEVADYVLKPFERARLEAAITKAKNDLYYRMGTEG
jgi:two-component system, LytTR family, response regulator